MIYPVRGVGGVWRGTTQYHHTDILYRYITVGVQCYCSSEGVMSDVLVYVFFQVAVDIENSDTKSSQRPKRFTAFFYHSYHTPPPCLST